MQNYQLYQLTDDGWKKVATPHGRKTQSDLTKDELLSFVELSCVVHFYSNVHIRLPFPDDPWFKENNVKMIDVSELEDIDHVTAPGIDCYYWVDHKSGAKNKPRAIFFKDHVIGRRFGATFGMD